MLSLVPEHVLSSLLADWLDPVLDLSVVASCVMERATFQRIVSQKGFVVRATKILSEETVAWHTLNGVRMQLLMTKETSFFGTQYWYRNGKLHRDGDLPAAVWADGTQAWYQNGQRHRDGGPAIVNTDGYQAWYQNGQRHRDGDLPAAVWADGTQAWYQNGQRHRDGDLPAAVWADGTQVWYHQISQRLEMYGTCL